uniref:Ion transport domain-containing protein n=1 Tax=Electrophorus electricus TaxID=8005 RepID=A0A4W4FMP6_ELEEL
MLPSCQSLQLDRLPDNMTPALSQFNYWWSQLRFRCQNKKGWQEMLDETFLLQYKRYFLHTRIVRIMVVCALGETALHVAVMHEHLEAAVELMDGAPELINEPMTTDLYQGITALHIAVINQNVNLVQELIQRGAHVSTPRATGMYFRKRRKGLIYYGEHILAFACCTGNKKMMSMLIKAGANIRAQDTLGNTLLHILILQPNKINACEIMEFLLKHDAEMDATSPLDMLPNYKGLTPFKLAAKKGNVVIFQHLVNRRRIVQWKLGPLSSYLYDLSEIDSRADDVSVLHLIVSSQKREARRILEVTPVQQLINLKWNLYGKYYFSYNTYEDHLRLGGEIISVVGALIILLLEIPDILRVGVKRYFGQTALGGPFHVTLIIYAVLVVALCVLRTSEMMGEMVLMALCLVLGWLNVLYFARGFEILGPYVIVIQKIIFGDLTKFMWLSLIAITGFSTAVWMWYITQEPLSVPQYRSFPITFFTEFELTIGLIDLPVDHTVYTHPVVHLVHCCFSVVSHLLLISLLTAMMSDTQWRVGQERDELWRTQVVATTLMLEQRLPRYLWPRLGECGLLYELGLNDLWGICHRDFSDWYYNYDLNCMYSCFTVPCIHGSHSIEHLPSRIKNL